MTEQGKRHGRGAPLVSVGLPVYNGGALLAETVESLLSQTLADFELIIADNASTDDTPAVCGEYERRDQRVRVIRHQRNIGAPGNWNFVARQARGRYLKWASASDLCAPQFLERCATALEAEPELALCFPSTEFVAADGRSLGTCKADFEVMAARPEERFAEVCNRMTVNNAQSGVIRMEMLQRTRLDRYYPHGDLVLMAELALQGRFRLLPEVLLYRRASGEHWTGERTPLQLERMFRPGAKRARRLLRTRREFDYLFSALGAPIPLGNRLRAAQFALKHFYWSWPEVFAELRSLLPVGEARQPS